MLFSSRILVYLTKWEMRSEKLDADMGNEKNLTSHFNNPQSHFSRLTSDTSSDPSRKTGYTLIEFLVVVGILALVVGSTTLFLTSVLRGTNKSNVTGEVKQNGQVVLDSLERQIRGASDVVWMSSSYIILVRNDDLPLHIQCFGQTSGSSPKNGRIGIVKAAVDQVSSMASYVSISNDDVISGVNIVNCQFNYIPADLSSGAGAPGLVSVEFEATQAINAPSRVEFQANAKFATTISLRTYK